MGEFISCTFCSVVCFACTLGYTVKYFLGNIKKCMSNAELENALGVADLASEKSKLRGGLDFLTKRIPTLILSTLS